MSRIVAIFPTTRAVIKAERLCKQNGITCKAIPVPRDISSECGIALEFDSSAEQSIKELFAKELIVVSQIKTIKYPE